MARLRVVFEMGAEADPRLLDPLEIAEEFAAIIEEAARRSDWRHVPSVAEAEWEAPMS